MERLKSYLGQNGVMRSEASRVRVRRPISYAHHNEDHVVGLDEDINKLVGVLITDEEHTKFTEVVSIVGMGGSGKTTLARKLFNQECVKKHFDCVAWVSISEQWVVKQILVELLRKARGESMRTDEVLSLEELVEKLHQCLERKRYLIVLDDVWEKAALQEILPLLPSVNDGRSIIVTTRKREVVDFPDLKCFIHEPRRLSEGESWELFTKIALNHNSMEITLLEALGKEMLKKCDGLPLAVVALAGILGKKETLEEWEKIKKAVSSRIMEDGRGTRLYGPVNQMLALSYTDLPRELKPCFLYLAIFPEDRVIQAGKLIRMWIAEGFITSDDLHEGETMEDVARGYLDELIRRCVVQIANKNYQGKVTLIRIHDLVRDLCIKKAKQQDFLEIVTSNSPNPDSRVTESRRTAIYSYDAAFAPFPTRSQRLRSLVYEANQIQNPGLQLIHQRFRDALNGEVVIRIPDVVWKIEGLRHLYLSSLEDKNVEGDKLRLHTLKYLQTLWGISGGNWMLKELPLLSQSVHKLYINSISSPEQLEAAFQCPSITFDRLHSLCLDWFSIAQEDELVTLKNLQAFAHCQHLRRLRLEEWSVERGAMPQLRRLGVSWCKRLSRISEGLKFITSLQELDFWFMSDEFKKRIRGGGEDAHIIQHVPHVEFFE